ncbi:MAG TPA: hypothetical protein VFQ67_09775 [Allosphingosinicella sp.]|jgi:hypothetical protein|nr:hypothetical protein [Allosphingosinicella sp.]
MAGKAFAAISKLAVAASLVTAGALAGPLAGAAEAKADAKKDPAKRVCRSITRAGTRLPTRLCLSQEEWDVAERKVQDGVLEHQMQKSTPGTAGPFDSNPR